ncbi:Zinc cadmium resistance [Hyphodiscus hymeniophilus]|uniref:Zinc cadmium resistance n=1 Tax=Hyphodiscus hymeniophilus TaxID=353542 RepID=A0A9P6VPW9_9HELO|nr:Zinc cadmium resistance [Hyphodiscus hymeniophilus]
MAWSKSTRIIVMLAIDAAFFVLELGVGLMVGSLALMADAFHMLNDIISLAVGLWAVKAAQKTSTDQFSFGYLRAEILGAAFNAVFLIALCLSIVLEAITRLIDPPEITNAKLILIVGSLGLVSNLAGFVVLGGHGHSHGSEEGHSHSHDNEVRDAEEGHSHSHSEDTNEDSNCGDVFPEAVIAKATSKSGQRIRFTSSSEDASRESNHSLNRSLSKASTRSKHRRRTSGRFTSPDDLSIHPSSFRQDIIAASRSPVDGPESGESSAGEGTAVADDDEAPTEASPLLSKSDKSKGSSPESNHHGDDNHAVEHDHDNTHQRHDSWHTAHNHNKSKEVSKGGSHGHSHADMGMNAMILHVMGDALGNVGVIVSALIIWLTNWSGRFYADPAVSLFITLIILKSTIPLTKATAKILLQATPDHIDVNDIKEDIQDIPGVVSCHHVHIWQLSDTQLVASMHIQVAFPISEASGQKYMELARQARKCLHAYGIHSATIQPEFCLDADHDHANPNGPVMGLDGIVGQQRCGLDIDECLLECVDDCTSKGCCPETSTVESGHDHSDYDSHTHQ